MPRAAIMDPMRVWGAFFDELSLFLLSAERQSSTGNASESFSHYVLEKIMVYPSSISFLLQHMRTTVEDNSVSSSDESSIISDYILLLEEVFQHIQSTAHEWELYLDEIYQHSHSAMYITPIVSSTHPRCGRPRFDISRDQLEYLSFMNFSWTKIASMLGVSRMTIYRRRVEYGIASSGIDLTDDELKVVLQQIGDEQPALGETMIWGRLKSMGFHITRNRLRFALREIDPLQQAHSYHAGSHIQFLVQTLCGTLVS